VRGTVDDLPSPYAFGTLLPSIYQEDDLALRFVSAFDVVLSSAVSTIDNIAAYFDPSTAPADLVEYLAGWVGVELDETWSDASRRELVSRAVELFRIRGTGEGLRANVAIYTGGEPEIEESGGCVASETADGEFPGSDHPSLVVRVRIPNGSTIDVSRVDRLVAAAKPAHIPHRVEVIST
jgi:phage tail-like protein